jgi:hypothetical protein
MLKGGKPEYEVNIIIKFSNSDILVFKQQYHGEVCVYVLYGGGLLTLRPTTKLYDHLL